MKAILLSILLAILSLASFAQAQKLTIYCQGNLTPVISRRMDYGNLDRLLPDSVKAGILVYPSKDVRLRNWNDLALWMGLHGWKLAAWDESAGGFNGNVSSDASLVFSRDIYLDDAARALLLQRVEEIERPRKKAD